MNPEKPDFKKLFEAVPGPYLVLLPDAPRFTITAVSDVYNQQTMTRREDILNKGLFEVFPDNPEDKRATGESNLGASLRRVLATKKPDVMAIQRYDIPRPKELGGGFEERYWMPKNTPIFNDQGDVQYIIHQVDNVTERVKLRRSGREQDAKLLEHSKELSRAQAELKEQNRRKDIFLATLAHELRNPLAPIRSGVELFKMGEAENEVLSTIERQVNHMSQLIDDLTDSSRISRGELSLNLEQVELCSLMKDIVAAANQGADNDHPSVSLNLPHGKVYLEADPLRLSQIISNLINNSQKFTPGGEEIKVVVQANEKNAVISVKDKGIGVKREKLQTIFDMFVQGEEPGKRQGLGLGLAISKMLVEMHGGKISANSEGIGKGLEVVVELPRMLSAPNPKKDKKSSESAPGNLKILVVDDNVDAANMLKLTLESWNNQVEVASDGGDAVERARRFRPDLIFMDLGLPTVDGYEAASQIIQRPWGKNIPIIALSGWGEQEDKERTKRQGFRAHLVKPVSAQELRKQIKAIIAK